MVKFLNEAFKGEWPDWAKKIFMKHKDDSFKHNRNGKPRENGLLKTNIDFANAVVHTDFNKSYLTDPTKLCFLKLESGPKDYSEISYLVKSGDGMVFCDDRVYVHDTLSWNDRKYSSKQSTKWLSDHLVDFCWIDMYGADASEIRSQRKQLNQIPQEWDRKREMGQRHSFQKVSKRDEFGDEYFADEWVWKDPWTCKADKSGYVRDPNKYIKKLTSLNADNYVEAINNMYKKVLDAKNDVSKLEVYDPSRMGSSERYYPRSLENTNLDEALYRLIATYNDFVYSVSRKLKNGTLDFENNQVNMSSFRNAYKEFKQIYDMWANH